METRNPSQDIPLGEQRISDSLASIAKELSLIRRTEEKKALAETLSALVALKQAVPLQVATTDKLINLVLKKIEQQLMP